MYSRSCLGLCSGLVLVALAAGAGEDGMPQRGPIDVAHFLPAGHATDGSASYQRQVQQALDLAAGTGREVRFSPIVYRLDDPAGLRVGSDCTLTMYGATFRLAPEIAADGQAFYGEDVRNVQFHGGTITGPSQRWPHGVNVRGIYLVGRVEQIRIRDMTIRDLTSNGVGIFGRDAEQPARHIWLTDTTIDRCSNEYGDYQAPRGELRGPEPDSSREDQGSVAFYHVEEFLVRGCLFQRSRSDGTHFYDCRNGQFSDNRVYTAKMGGYFLETCEHVVSTNNVIRDNGSRGVTIERGSRACTLVGNTVEGSGREGLWMPDCSHCVVTGNLFVLNGRKPNGSMPQSIWNSNITINDARGDPTNSPTEHYLIADNVIDTDSGQYAAIRVDANDTVRNIVIRGNLLVGENRRIALEGEHADRVVARDNGEPE